MLKPCRSAAEQQQKEQSCPRSDPYLVAWLSAASQALVTELMKRHEREMTNILSFDSGNVKERGSGCSYEFTFTFARRFLAWTRCPGEGFVSHDYLFVRQTGQRTTRSDVTQIHR